MAPRIWLDPCAPENLHEPLMTGAAIVVVVVVENLFDDSEVAPDLLWRSEVDGSLEPVGLIASSAAATRFIGLRRPEILDAKQLPDLRDRVETPASDRVANGVAHREGHQLTLSLRCLASGGYYGDGLLDTTLRPIRDHVDHMCYDGILVDDFSITAEMGTDEHAIMLLMSSYFAIFDSTHRGGQEEEVRQTARHDAQTRARALRRAGSGGAQRRAA
jgi:hypothetical protein